MKETKTSQEWQKQFPHPLVYDADGWDRKNWIYSNSSIIFFAEAILSSGPTEPSYFFSNPFDL